MNKPVICGITINSDADVIAALSEFCSGDEEAMKDISVIDDYALAIVGFSEDYRLVYSYNNMVKLLMERNEMAEEDAMEFININVIPAVSYMERPPIILYPADYYMIEEKVEVNRLSEQNFKTVLTELWISFSKAKGLVDILERIGLNVDPNKQENMETDFSALYAIQEKASITILKLLDIDKNIQVENTRQTILEALDQFLFDLYAKCPNGDMLPEDQYQALLTLLAKACKTFPWEVI